MPLAPGLLSMTMPTPSAAAKCWEMIRVVVSVPLPAANGNTSVMVRFGYAVCAEAAETNPAKIDANTAAARKRCVSEITLFRPMRLLDRFLAGQASLPATKAEAD